MFLNVKDTPYFTSPFVLNRKHEMFLNLGIVKGDLTILILTVNMKCF